jgi:hypothetical protein
VCSCQSLPQAAYFAELLYRLTGESRLQAANTADQDRKKLGETGINWENLARAFLNRKRIDVVDL